LYLAFLAKYLPKVLTKISATGMVEAALAPLHIKGGSPCEYPHRLPNRKILDGSIVWKDDYVWKGKWYNKHIYNR
jgi:hypothetical protein